MYVKDPRGGPETRLIESGNPKSPSDWSRDGLLYTEIDSKTRADLWILPAPLDAAPGSPVKVLKTEFNESMGQFSPDGRWIAYVSDESGQEEVYVRRYPVEDTRWKVSRSRATQPRWRRDGKELFFMAGTARYTHTAVPIRVTQDRVPEIGDPQSLFTFEILTTAAINNQFDYSPSSDGQRFLVNRQAGGTGTLNVVTNWERAVATGAK